jgi:hypothetical protein
METKGNAIAGTARSHQPNSIVECELKMRQTLFECLGATKQVYRNKPTGVWQQPSDRPIKINRIQYRAIGFTVIKVDLHDPVGCWASGLNPFESILRNDLKPRTLRGEAKHRLRGQDNCGVMLDRNQSGLPQMPQIPSRQRTSP